MGRQAYLAKIAFGRSAFEPTPSASQSTEYVQLESAQSGLPRLYQEATANSYVQLYDERGNPIHPHSHSYGKKLRDAQNDVLASVGVVERRRSPSEGLPGSNEEHLDLLEAEDNVGNAIHLASTLTENLCTWWIGILRDRLLTFRYRDAVPFAQIVASERAMSGANLVYTGIAPYLLAAFGKQAVVYSAFVYQPIDRLIYSIRASQKTRSFVRRSNNAMKSILALTLEILFYPFHYHSNLQRLGLVPAEPLLPPWRTLIPFSRASPLLPISLHYDPFASVADCVMAALTSPIILVCVEQVLERWFCARMSDAVESSMLRPDNAGMYSRDASGRDGTRAMLSPRQQSPSFIRHSISNLLTFLGWCQPLETGKAERKRSTESAQTQEPCDGPTFGIDSAQIIDLTALALPVVQNPDLPVANSSGIDVIPTPLHGIDNMTRPTTPPTPTALTPDQEDNDPRIRITSREGIVEMEVRLPPRILSTHTEAVEAPASTPNRRATYRITQLSSEPAQTISAVVTTQLVGIAMLPFRLVVLRLIATRYLAIQEGHTSRLGAVRQLPSLSDLTWRCIGTQISRVALCGMLELTVDLSLWGLQYLAITRTGQSIFGWGAL
ncbi:hypothetical protein BKA66DRAFT_510513 [Pyrenochaeta sp. MPI-SDFR-AT-0127]|nr:hypothetical protein BKA66DRAFT_510513 [Pyrenochaeta sp. MPI-SDFR-AT-0127]